MSVRHLCLILGDQLDRDSSLFRHFHPQTDRLWMAEVREESTHVWSHKQRIALFLAAMRHFAAELNDRGWPLDYQRLEEHEDPGLGAALARAIRRWRPRRVRLVWPGDYRVLEQIRGTCSELRTPLDLLEDDHFLSSPEEFRRWAAERRQLRLEYWYRPLRQRHANLLESDGSAPLEGVEGFIRQILGWRDFARGLYWLHMPEWLEWNALAAEQELPGFYWNGDTGFNCLRQSIGQVSVVKCIGLELPLDHFELTTAEF